MARKVARAFIDSRARLSFTSFSFVYRLVQRANAHWRVTAATKTSKAAAQQQRIRRCQRSDASSESSKLLLQSSPDCSLFCSQLLLLLRLRWCWQLVVAVVVAVVLTCCCFRCCFCGVVAGRNAFSGAAAAFCLRLCFFWRVSKLRRPRANLRKWEQRCQTVRNLFGGIKAKLVRKKINERLRAWSMAYWYLRYAEFDKFQISYKLTI